MTEIKIPNGKLQREILLTAPHGDPAWLSGGKNRDRTIATLQKRGFLDEDRRPTEQGQAAIDWMNRSTEWYRLPAHVTGLAGRNRHGYGVASAIAVWSTDRRHVYVTTHSASGQVDGWKVDPDSISAEVKKELGLLPSAVRSGRWKFEVVR